MAAMESESIDPQQSFIDKSASQKRELLQYVTKMEDLNTNYYSRSDCYVNKDNGEVYYDMFKLDGHKLHHSIPSGANVIGLVPGDHIYYRGAFGIDMAEHHALYVGGGYVVEAWINSSVPGYQRALFTAEFRPGMIDSRNINDFTDNGSKVIFRRDYIPDRSLSERQESVHRAINAMGTRGYNLFRANCEHFVCEMTVPGNLPESQQIKYIDKPVVIGKICEDIVLDLLHKKDSIIYLQDAELYLRIYKNPNPTESDLGNLRSMAQRYGITSTSDGTPIYRMTRDQLLAQLRVTMLFNLAKASPSLYSMVREGLERLPVPEESIPFLGRRKRARV